MAATSRSTIVGVFEDRQQADRAVADLRRAGFRDDQIGIAMRRSDASGDASTADSGGETYAEEGATTGVLTGLGLGALAGLGVLAGVIPVVGPAIVGGTLGIILSNAAAGAAAAGLAGALIGYGIPEDEAQYYHGEFEAGRTIVTVQAEGRRDEAMTILQQYGAYDMANRGSSASAASGGSSSHGASGTIEVKEERLHAEKTPVQTGEVTVRKEVHTETKHLEVPVHREEVVIERNPVHGRAASSGVADNLREGEEIRIPVREEQVHVSKEAVVTEEVKVGKRVVQDTEHVSGQVRKEEVHVEQHGDVDVRTRGTGEGTR